jgi:hypothetical protein
MLTGRPCPFRVRWNGESLCLAVSDRNGYLRPGLGRSRSADSGTQLSTLRLLAPVRKDREMMGG